MDNRMAHMQSIQTNMTLIV